MQGTCRKSQVLLGVYQVFCLGGGGGGGGRGGIPIFIPPYDWSRLIYMSLVILKVSLNCFCKMQKLSSVPSSLAGKSVSMYTIGLLFDTRKPLSVHGCMIVLNFLLSNLRFIVCKTDVSKNHKP